MMEFMSVVEVMFIEMCEALGYATWYEAEEAWEDMAEIMIEAGMDADEVEEFFDEMAEDL